MVKTEFKIGESIDNRYRVLSVIGAGGMGTLYRVRDEVKDDEVVALKTLRQDTTEGVERFQREFQLLTQLRHPNLVSVYNYGITAEDQLYFTMEWIQGQDLDPSRRPLAPGSITPVIVQICRALAYLHARGVIHGDLKPQNVLLASDDGGAGQYVKIVDFGVVLEMRSPETRAQYYTPDYAAPEMRQLRPIDQRADLYSLGALWYALLLGEPPPSPRRVSGYERLVRLMLVETLEAQEAVPVDISAVTARLLALSPADRYTSANEVIAAVNETTGSAYALETQETASSYALRTHFVNRETELEMFQAAWQEALDGEGRVVLVSGGSGVGKTRLVTELEVQVELEGARVVWGQCVEQGGEAYHPWREVLRVLVRYVEAAAVADTMQQVGPIVAALLPELWQRDYMAGLAPAAELDSQAAQLRLNDAIVRVMRAAAGLRPTVVVIENAHWADEATLELLRYLVRVPGAVGLLVCVTYRDDEVDAEHLLETLAGDRVQRVRVHRLSPQVTTDLARAMLGLEQLPVLLAERVQQTTGGNAFFVQELIRSLAAEGKVLRRTVEGWRVDGEALRQAQLPKSIRQVVERRLVQLSEYAQRVLEWAAVVGPVFWEGVVAEVGQAARARVRSALGELSDLELIAGRDETAFAGEREYLFLNPTVREISYESIPQAERQEAHGRIGAWLMAHGDEQVNEHLGLIADHLERAGQTEQAVIYLRRAGEQAAAQFANAEAIAYLSRALDLIPEDNRAERYALLMVRERVYDLQGAREVQTQDLAALKELAEALDADAQPDVVGSRQAEVALRQARYADATSDYPAAIAAARKAIQIAQVIQDTDLQATGHLEWGIALRKQGDYEAARARLEQTLALAREGGNRYVEAESLHYLGQVFWACGQQDQAEVYTKQALSLYREIDHRVGESNALNTLGNVSTSCNDYLGSKNYYEQTLHIAREIGHRQYESHALINLGNCFLHWGDYAEGQRLTKEALPIQLEIGGMEGWIAAQNNLAWLLHLGGDNQAARDASTHAIQVAQQTGERRMQGYSLTVLGYALEGLGQLEEAAKSYQQAIDLRQKTGQHHLIIESLAGMARVSLAQGNLELSLAQVEEILTRLEDNALDSTEEPMRIYLTCYRVLQANDDPRAWSILDAAYQALQEQAAAITDQEIRRSFLENVPYHREIVQEFEKQSKEGRP